MNRGAWRCMRGGKDMEMSTACSWTTSATPQRSSPGAFASHLRRCKTGLTNMRDDAAMILAGGAGARLFPLTKVSLANSVGFTSSKAIFRQSHNVHYTPPIHLDTRMESCREATPHGKCKMPKYARAKETNILYLHRIESTSETCNNGRTRASPAVPIGGMYRLIDVPMVSFVLAAMLIDPCLAAEVVAGPAWTLNACVMTPCGLRLDATPCASRLDAPHRLPAAVAAALARWHAALP
eukprot:360679-Chlamydomonas_euryale.AAC.6